MAAHGSGTIRLVLADSKALGLFEHDSCVKIIPQRKELLGYELYIVEQWAASRDHLTSLIATFTGLTHHKIKVHVIEIPAEEKDWSDRLRTYIENTSKAPARRKETALGTLMVTNLSSFASTLTVVNIPGGDYDDYRDVFMVNENLKRLGCSGRAGLKLSEPSEAAEAKFRQLYHTGDAVKITDAAIELVRLCQVALVLYAQLAREYTDGLLCDITIAAVKEWWMQIGSEHFNIEPSDGPLGPITVAALLGLLQGARIRLQALNAPIGKDVFDLRSTKRAIEAFQRWYRIERTRRLDAKTLDRLHSLTSKYVNSKEWMVPRAVKSTIPQLGKGGEMVMGMVGNKDKAGIAEIETLDITTLADTASGDTAKWLWQGKRGKPAFEDTLSRYSSDEDLFSADEAPGRPYRKRDIVLDKMSAIGNRGEFYNLDASSQVSFNPSDREQSMPKHVLKSVTGRMNDAKTGLGRFRDAVGIPGFRGHASKFSKDQGAFSDDAKGGLDGVRSFSGESQASPPGTKVKSKASPGVQSGQTSPSHSPPALRLKREQMLAAPTVTGRDLVVTPSEMTPPPQYKPSMQLRTPSTMSLVVPDPVVSAAKEPLVRSTSYIQDQLSDLMGKDVTRRTLSYGSVSDALGQYGRHRTPSIWNDPPSEYAHNMYLTEMALAIKRYLKRLDAEDLSTTKKLMQRIRESDTRIIGDIEDIEKHYFSLLGDHDVQQQSMADAITSARSTLGDTLTSIEGVMAKLEYELNMLASKVEDVEDGVAEFEDQVIGLETRARKLEPKEQPVESWYWRMLRLALGLA